MPPFSGAGLWETSMPQLLYAIEAAHAAKRTPLLLDHTLAEGASGFSPLETYYFYSGDHLIEMKKMVVGERGGCAGC